MSVNRLCGFIWTASGIILVLAKADSPYIVGAFICASIFFAVANSDDRR